MSTRLLKTIILIAMFMACGTGLWWALRNPVADVPRGVSSQPTGVATSGKTVRVKRPSPPSNAFAGSAVCAGCHSEISKSYQAHPMGRSLAHVQDTEPMEDYVEKANFNAPPSSRTNLTLHYYIEKEADGIFHHEQMLEPDGDVVYDQSVPVHYAIGSGKRGRSYVTNRDGILLMSPISWYSQKHRWDYSPGYDVKNLRFERRVKDGCLTCHSGRMSVAESQQPHRYAADPFIEASIGCEQCHGPAQEHVAFHLGSAREGQADPIVNPIDLEPSRRDSVCYQCHLNGAQRILRYGRTEFDFRPGDLVSDIWTIFVRGTGVENDQTTEAVTQVEQMASSQCYSESDGRLGCVSCHDAHSTPASQQRIAFYRSRCLTCHGEGQTHCSLPVTKRLATTAEDSCIVCHMPPMKANNVPHTSQTDHRVLRSPQSHVEAEVGNQSVLSVFGEEESRMSPAELDRARGLLFFIHAERRGNSILAEDSIPLLENWLKAAPDDQSVAQALGAAYWMNRNMEQAYSTWNNALSLNPNNEEILRRLLTVSHDSGRFEEGIRYARRLVALNPWHYDYYGRLAHMHGRLKQFQEGIKAAERAVELNPAATLMHGWLSEAYPLVGERAKAEKHRAKFEKLKLRSR
jgi:Tfp pilus assembly protein PilF